MVSITDASVIISHQTLRHAASTCRRSGGVETFPGARTPGDHGVVVGVWSSKLWIVADMVRRTAVLAVPLICP